MNEMCIAMLIIVSVEVIADGYQLMSCIWSSNLYSVVAEVFVCTSTVKWQIVIKVMHTVVWYAYGMFYR